MRWDEIGKQQCSIARSSAVLGDRWTLVILSECFLGVRRFDNFQRRLAISRTTLTNRLTQLESHGVLARKQYRNNPPRIEYRLTDKGRDLYPVLSTLLNWGDTYYSGEAGPPILRRHRTCGHDIQPVLCCPKCDEPVDARNVEAHVRPDDPKYPPVERGPFRRPVEDR